MRVFVYGSLRRGEVNHHVLDGACFVRTAKTAPIYDLVDLGTYPGLVQNGRTSVFGEVYEVDQIAALDQFEGPKFYRRSPVQLADGEVVEAYFYRTRPLGAPRVLSGDWCVRPRR